VNRALWVFCLAISLAGAATGCHDSEIEKLERVRDRACACKTPACGDATLADVPGLGSGEHPSLRAQKVAGEIFRCVSKLHLDHPDDGSDQGSDLPGSDSGSGVDSVTTGSGSGGSGAPR
jgi:hypothetical protein